LENERASLKSQLERAGSEMALLRKNYEGQAQGTVQLKEELRLKEE
jgi:hypothetical protein